MAFVNERLLEFTACERDLYFVSLALTSVDSDTSFEYIPISSLADGTLSELKWPLAKMICRLYRKLPSSQSLDPMCS
jgi:hypothetical protein